MAESLPILGPRSLILETETLTVPNSNTSAQAWAVHHWVYDSSQGGTGGTGGEDGPNVVSALTVGWRNVAPGSNAAYNVYMEKDGTQTPLTQTPVTGETVTLTGTNVATLPWCNQAPGGGTETLSVVAVDSTASTSVALPPGSCYDNGTGIAWMYSYQYYATDHLGTVRAAYTVAADGTTNLQTFAYEPFGVEIPGAVPDTCDNTHKFTGHERDTETGNDYMHYRFYAAGMGRFMKPDNVMGQIGDPQSFDLYTYVRCHPILMNDPTGHWSKGWHDTITFLAYAFTGGSLTDASQAGKGAIAGDEGKNSPFRAFWTGDTKTLQEKHGFAKPGGEQQADVIKRTTEAAQKAIAGTSDPKEKGELAHPVQDAYTHGRYVDNHVLEGTTPDQPRQNVPLAVGAFDATMSLFQGTANDQEDRMVQNLAQAQIYVSYDSSSNTMTLSVPDVNDQNEWSSINQAMSDLSSSLSLPEGTTWVVTVQ
jgi:RHS repeat-associated protein